MPRRTSSRANRTDSESLTSASETAARIFGIIFIVLGLGLIIALVGGFIVSKLPYRVDPNLPIPTLNSVDDYTNKDTIEVSGTVLPGETVVLYQDDDRLSGEVETDEDGGFIFEDVELDEEGDTTFEAAVIRGGVFKRRSEFSNSVLTVVDWTPPSTAIALEYEETNVSGKATIRGTADPNSTIIIESETETFEATADEDGAFELTNVKLSPGTNEYEVRIKDLAGNEVVASDMVTIAYEMGDVNGDGAAVGPNGERLPESAGSLEDALAYLAGNKLMLAFALMSILVFTASSYTAKTFAKRRNG